MSRRPSWVTWRVVLAAGVMWLADLAWDLYEWLQGVSWRIQQPGRRSQRGLARLLVLAALSGASLTAGLAWGLRGTEERPGVEAGRVEAAPAQDLWAAAAEGCIRAGGTWWQGSEGGVVVARCRPFISLGVAPVPASGKGVRR